MKTAGALCQFFEGDTGFAVPSEQGDGRTDLCFRHLAHIRHELIHADAPQNATALPVNQDLSLVTERARITVPVTDRHRGNPHGALRDKSSAVADGSADRQLFDIGHGAVQGQNRFQSQRMLHFRRGIDTVNRNAGPHHIVVCAAQIQNTRGICDVANAGGEASLPERGAECAKTLFLQFRGLLRSLVRAIKVGKHALKIQAGKGCDALRKPNSLRIRTEPDAMHAGIHREMKSGLAPQFLCRL